MLETALIGPVFFTLIMLMLDMGYQLAVDVAVQYGTANAARYAVTGAITGTSGGSNATNNATVANYVIATSGGFLDPTKISVTSLSYASPTTYVAGSSPTSNSNGLSGSVVVYKVTYTAPYLTGLPGLIASITHTTSIPANISHNANVVVQNEPY